jgi:hypothetical protein
MLVAPIERRCVLEYGKFKHHIQKECELARGKYIEAFFTSECTLGNTSKFEYAAINEPYCIGEPCDSDESVNLVENDIINIVHAQYERGGYRCSIRYVRAVQFITIYRRITEAPVQNPTSMPTTANLTPTPVGGIASKKPISSAAQILPTSSTSNPAVAAHNEKVFGVQTSALSVKEERRNTWRVPMIVIIAILAFAVSQPLWERLLLHLKPPPEKAGEDDDSRELTLDDISLGDDCMRAFDSWDSETWDYFSVWCCVSQRGIGIYIITRDMLRFVIVVEL